MTEKFLFNLNDFSLDAPENIDEEAEEQELPPPPPPTFTESELEAAKAQAYKEGKKAGFDESETSKTKSIENSVQSLALMLANLIGNEGVRAKTYENEVVLISEAIFSTILPDFVSKHGLEELKAAISNALRPLENLKSIEILCSEEEKGAIESYFSSDSAIEGVVFKADSTISPGDCHIRWKDGGAIHNASEVTDKIRIYLEQTLEENGIKSHDEEVKDDDTRDNCDIIDNETPDIDSDTASDDGDDT